MVHHKQQITDIAEYLQKLHNITNSHTIHNKNVKYLIIICTIPCADDTDRGTFYQRVESSAACPA